MDNASIPTAVMTESGRGTESPGCASALPNLGSSALPRKLTLQAQDRALGVLADPVTLQQAGAAVPLLAVVNERCEEQMCCRLKYADVARELVVSVTTVKAWADTLEKLGYFTRKPCGPAGVDIRLRMERWPSRERSNALTAMSQRTVAVLEALRITVDGVLASAVTDVRGVGEETA